MEQIVIGVDNSSNSSILISLLENLQFVKWIERENNTPILQLPPSKFKSKEDFWETFGSGKHITINLKHIRKKAWRKTQL